MRKADDPAPPGEGQIARELCDSIGLKREIDAASLQPERERAPVGNVRASSGPSRVAAACPRQGQRRDRGPSSSNFLHHLTMSSEEGAEPGNMVTLDAPRQQGPEFGVVFLIGCERGFIPHQRTLDSRLSDDVENTSDIEEERRLFYVGITRAKQRLTMTRCKTASRAASPSCARRAASSDIPDDMLDHFEVKTPLMSMTEMAEQGANLMAMLDAMK